MKRISGIILFLFCLVTLFFAAVLPGGKEHGYVENNDVRLHYVTSGRGPLVVMLHGFPDYWYTWRFQMDVLAGEYQVVAMDLRGYNLSDKPPGIENYAMRHLIGDVAALISHFPQKKAVVIGHDWGGAIAWQVSIWRPDLVDRLIVLSTPHPNGLFRELQGNKQQQDNSQYARDFQKPDAHKTLTAESLAAWVTDRSAKDKYLEAFRRSDFEAMLNYYKASFPKAPAVKKQTPPAPPAAGKPRRVQCPTLVLFGLEDKALLASGFNDTWQWIDNDLTLVAIPGAGHFIQQDAREMVTRSIVSWLKR